MSQSLGGHLRKGWQYAVSLPGFVFVLWTPFYIMPVTYCVETILHAFSIRFSQLRNQTRHSSTFQQGSRSHRFDAFAMAGIGSSVRKPELPTGRSGRNFGSQADHSGQTTRLARSLGVAAAQQRQRGPSRLPARIDGKSHAGHAGVMDHCRWSRSASVERSVSCRANITHGTIVPRQG